MCGICVVLDFVSTVRPAHQGCQGQGIDSTSIVRAIQRRGPDSCRTRQMRCSLKNEVYAGMFTASVLRMQSSNICNVVDEDLECSRWRQPLGFVPKELVRSERQHKRSRSFSAHHESHSRSSFLLWNGEVFGGQYYQKGHSDTRRVFEALSTAEQDVVSLFIHEKQNGSNENLHQYEMMFLCKVRDILEGIHGPFAMVYVAVAIKDVLTIGHGNNENSQEDRCGGVIIVGRDPLGRRSLCVHYHNAPIENASPGRWKEQICISSVCGCHTQTEINISGPPIIFRDVEDSHSAHSCCWFELPIDGIYVLGKDVFTTPEGKHYMQHVSQLTNGLMNRVLPWAYRHVRHPLVMEHRLSLIAAQVETSLRISSSNSMFERFFAELQRFLFQDESEHQGPSREDLAFFLTALQTVHYPFNEKATRMDCIGASCADTNTEDSLVNADALPEAAARYLAALVRSVWRRVAAHANAFTETNVDQAIMVPLSGGIDSTVLVALAHYILPLSESVSVHSVVIEMPNIAFGADPSQAPDRQSACVAVGELLALPGAKSRCQCVTHENVTLQNGFQLVLVNGGDASGFLESEEGRITISSRIEHLISPCRTIMDHNIGTAVWWAVRGEGVLIPPVDLPKWVEENYANCASSRLVRTVSAASEDENGNQFAGENGIFQPLLDALIAEGSGDGFILCTPTNSPDKPFYRAAVRLSTLGKEYARALRPAMAFGIEVENSFVSDESKKRKPFRKIIDYCHAAQSKGLVKVFSGEHFPTLPTQTSGVHPTTTKVVALARECDIERGRHFCSGRHILVQENVDAKPSEPSYRCHARTVLLGMGADETLGGYTRHRRTFERFGITGLRDELDGDFERLWSRNLGRDDRIAADHGREARFPFLDEEVLATLSHIAQDRKFHSVDNLNAEGVQQICNPALPEGVGDKRILRTVARCLGLRSISRLVKRAVQFGTRIANPKANGAASIESVSSTQLTKLAHS